MPKINFKFIRILTAMYVSVTVSVAVTTNNGWLALFGIGSGLIFLWAMKRKFQIRSTDEMLENIGGKAARMAFSVMTTVLALLSLLFHFLGEPTGYLAALAIIFSYLTLSLIAVYSLAFYYYQKQLT